jgi:hypothetical protein
LLFLELEFQGIGHWSEPILPDTEDSQLPGNGVKVASNSAGGK